MQDRRDRLDVEQDLLVELGGLRCHSNLEQVKNQ